MRGDEPRHPTVEGDRQHDASSTAARSMLHVQGGDARLVPRRPPSFLEAVREVHVFHVHPIALVEEPDLLECAATKEHERAVDRIYSTAFHGWCAVLRKPSAACAAADPAQMSEGPEHGWDRPT